MRWRDDLLVALGALPPVLLFLFRERQIAGAAGFPLDDSWIHLHFARNLAEGAGFAYNPGVPVAGSTAPLWTLALALVAALAGASLASAKVLGVVTAVAAALVTRRAALAWGASREVALGAGLALLWTGAMAWGALSGMEVTLAALLVAAALLAHARERTAWTALFAALAVLARPEALLLVPFLALARPLTVRRAVTFAAVTALVVSPMIVFSMLTVGAPYPATAAAKVEGGMLGWLSGLREPAARTWVTRPLEFLGQWVRWLGLTHWLLPLALLPAIAVAWVRHGRALALPALVLFAHPLGMALLAPYRGPAFQEGRYSIHLLPLAVLVMAVALGAARARLRVAALVVYLVIALGTLVPASARYAWGVQNINAMQVHLGHWVDDHVPPTARLAVNDIGAIAFFSRRQVLDLMGLVTPEVIAYRREGEAGIFRYITATCPDFVIIFPTWFPRLAASVELLQPVYRVRLARPEVTGGPEMVVYRLTRCTV